MQTTKVLSPRLDYITLKGCFYPCSKEEIKSYLLNYFGFSIEDCFYESLHRKEVYFFKQQGIDFKIFNYHFEIEFHSTFFARYPNALAITKEFCGCVMKHLNILAYPIAFDVARDVTNYDVSEFLKITENPENFQFSFKGRAWCREVKSGKVETVYLHGPKSRWKLCVYDKTKELNDNWHKMTDEKREYYKDYLEQQVTRFELRVRSEFIKNNVIDDYFNEDDEEAFCLKILGAWSKRRTIYKKNKDEFVTRNNRHRHQCEPIFEMIFKTNMSSSGLPSLRLESTKALYDLDSVKRRIAKIFVRGEISGILNSFELSSYLRDARDEAKEIEKRYRESYEHLSSLIAS